MTDITELFESLLAEHDSIDIAEAEFKRLIAEDSGLKEMYSDWCEAVGSTEKHGFFDFAEEYKDSCDSVWDSLTDYDE